MSGAFQFDGDNKRWGAPMKCFTVWVLVMCLAGCTTMRPVTGTSSDLQQRLASGGLIKRGDHVVIVMTDGSWHEFTVTSLDASTIDGKRESIPIDQVTSIQKRQLNVGKTLLVIGLTLVGAAAVDALVVGIGQAGAAAAGGY
jgi:hypothetical protein